MVLKYPVPQVSCIFMMCTWNLNNFHRIKWCIIQGVCTWNSVYTSHATDLNKGGDQGFVDFHDICVWLSALPSFYIKCTHIKYWMDGVDVNYRLVKQKMMIFLSFLGIPQLGEFVYWFSGWGDIKFNRVTIKCKTATKDVQMSHVDLQGIWSWFSHLEHRLKVCQN